MSQPVVFSDMVCDVCIRQGTIASEQRDRQICGAVLALGQVGQHCGERGGGGLPRSPGGTGIGQALIDDVSLGFVETAQGVALRTRYCHVDLKEAARQAVEGVLS